jgi:hypothetical protein
MAIPTLTMIPSGYKSQKVYSVLPTNGDGDFTFDRTTTATRVNKDGLIEQVATDVPRLDYSDGSCPSLLLEPASVNLALYSQDFSQSDWSVFDVSKSANSVLSPDGTLNGARITALDGTNKALQQLVTVSADPSNDRVFTGSIYIKSSSVTSCFLRVGSATSNNAITITSEWQRFEAQYTLAATFTAVRLGIVLNNEGDEVDVAFGQVEELPYASSYIPTPTNSSASRSAETFSNDFSSQPTVANTNTVVLKFIPMGFSTDFNELLRFSDGTNEISLEGFQTNNYDVYGSGLTSSGMVDGALSLDAGSINTVSFSYSGTSLRFSHNGSTINTVAPTGNLPTITEVSHSVGGLSPIKILDLRVYNDFKTQEELNTLTK